MSEPADPRQIARLRAALRRLPDRQRAIFLALISYDAPTYAELSVRFEIDLSKVEQEFAQALATLAGTLDD